MDKTEFRTLRKRLSRTQKQMAQLLGVSLKAVHSYEQGWRTVPPAVERHLLFLASLANTVAPATLCWDVRGCPPERRAECPASQFDARRHVLADQRDALQRLGPGQLGEQDEHLPQLPGLHVAHPSLNLQSRPRSSVTIRPPGSRTAMRGRVTSPSPRSHPTLDFRFEFVSGWGYKNPR